MDPSGESRHAGDSAEQREAERVLMETLGAELGVVFDRARRRTAEGANIELDEICEEPPILVEAWAHQGLPRPVLYERPAALRSGSAARAPRAP